MIQKYTVEVEKTYRTMLTVVAGSCKQALEEAQKKAGTNPNAVETVGVKARIIEVVSQKV